MTARPWEAPEHSYGPIIESFNYGQISARECPRANRQAAGAFAAGHVSAPLPRTAARLSIPWVPAHKLGPQPGRRRTMGQTMRWPYSWRAMGWTTRRVGGKASVVGAHGRGLLCDRFPQVGRPSQEL
jgi:hypothetical protein